MRGRSREWIAIWSLVIAAGVAFAGIQLQRAVTKCDDAKYSLTRIEILSALDIIVIDQIEKSSSEMIALSSERPSPNFQENKEKVEELLVKAPAQRWDAVQQYLSVRDDIDEVSELCDGLDAPKWLLSLLEWLANLLSAVLVFFGGLQIGTLRSEKRLVIETDQNEN